MQRLISKSKFVAGRQCVKLLWNQLHAPHRIPPVDASTQFVFDQGHAVGRLAQRLVPGGVEVPHGRMWETVEATRRLLDERRPVYEASFAAGGVYCRVDILEPTRDGRWNLLEVKSSTRLKDVNVADVAVQTHCLEAAGVALDRLFLVHVDREYVRRGEVEPERLLRRLDITESVREHLAAVGVDVWAFHAMLDGAEPDVPIGPHCRDPYECSLQDRCWAHLHEHAPTVLHRAGARAFEWLARGYEHLVDVPSSELTGAQRIQREAVRLGRAHVDRAALRAWLDRLRHPVVFLDFEAAAPAVPLFDGTRPYEPIAFQASAHVVDRPGAEPVHHEFLHMEPTDPRAHLVEFLRRLPPHGSVVAWHSSYEAHVIEGLADACGAVELVPLRERLVDLEEPFRDFLVHHPAQYGRTSVKSVLPVLTDLGYEGDAITRGDVAAARYLRTVHGWPDAPQMDAFAAEELAAELRRYCGKDTLAMVEILRVLEDLARGEPTT